MVVNTFLTVAIIAIVGFMDDVHAIDCYACKSDTLASCATLQFPPNTIELPIETCTTSSSCYSFIRDGITVRGCEPPHEEGCTIDCELCSDNKCNGKIYPSDRLTCSQCTGDNCVSTPPTPTPCRNYDKDDSCYAAFSLDGKIGHRGCLSDNKETVGRQYCDAHDQYCTKCKTTGCNINVPALQANPLSCVKCDSLVNPNCINLQASIDATTCGPIVSGFTDSCYTHIVKGVVKRGCLSEQKYLEVDCVDKNICTLCTATNCNRQIFQPEFCYVCNSEVDENCRTNLATTMETQCPLSVRPLGCYRYDDGGSIIKRGCLSSIHPGEIEMCQANEQFCKICTERSCNKKINFERCHHCSSSNNLNCILSTYLTQSKFCTNYLDKCFSHVVNNVVTRGCILDSDREYGADCQNHSDVNKCELCTDVDNCNNKIIEGDDFCYTCDSRNDPNCTNNLDDSMKTQCNLSLRKLGCYRSQEGDIVKRGCLSELTSDEIDMCFEQGEFCKTCTGRYCNQKIDFQKCHTCNSTTSPGCIRSGNAAQSVTCKHYTDECFVHTVNDIVIRGCLHDTELVVQTDCLENNDFCEKCATASNCNDKIVDGEFCLTCSSEDDPNCRDKVDFQMRTQCKLSVRQRGCYRYDDGGGIIKRGCVSDIHEGEVAMCRKQEQFCKTCLGNDCNAKVNFQTCHVCNSSSSVNCIRSPHVFPTITCQLYLDDCYSHVQNDIVTRGCLSQAGTPVKSDCADDESDLCDKCSTADCNKKLIDGEFCLTCDSEIDSNCRNKVDYKMRKQCSLAVKPRGCYRYHDGGDIVKRGCVSDIHPGEVAMCRKQEQFCKTCLGNDCNEKVEFTNCIACTSNSSVGCIRSPNSFQSVLCRNYLDECFNYVENDIVVRGCWLQSTETIQKSCTENSDFCDLCSSPNCNNKIVDGEFCLSCDSEVNDDCRENLNHTLRVQCKLAVRKRGCYRYDDGGEIIKRGCISDIHPDEVAMCRREKEFCKTCVGNDCNSKILFPNCITCNSTTSVNCIRSPNGFPSIACSAYSSDCFVHVDNDVISRGCLSEFPQFEENCKNKDLCEKCAHPKNCNNRIVDGEFCITCNSQDDPNCRDSLDVKMRTQCTLSVNPQGCFLMDDGVNVSRGCVSELPTYEKDYCRNKADICKICEGNDCNTKIAFQTCHTCSSTYDCTRPTPQLNVTLCDNYLDKCYTYMKDDQVVRGCLAANSEAQEMCTDPEICEICTDNVLCNNKNLRQEFCIHCDSLVTPSCTLNPTQLMVQTCSPILTFNRKGCYRHELPDGSVRRGCGSDLSQTNLQLCQDGTSNCKICDENNCNQKVGFQRCLTCNSTDDFNCITASEPINDKECLRYADNCRRLVIEGGQTERGCSSELSNNPFIFDECTQNNCNGRYFPAVRQVCHQCASNENCNGEQSDASLALRACRNFSSKEKCYAFVNNQGHMNRGCQSDKTAGMELCKSLGQKCQLCDATISGCNKHPTVRPARDACIKCNNKDACAWGHLEQNATRCTDDIIFPNAESCFTYIHDDGVVTRGCTLENETLCDSNEIGCVQCTGRGCNNHNVVTQNCKRCLSDKAGEESCAFESPANNLTVQCTQTHHILEYEDRGCYTFNKDGVIERGCISDLNPTNRTNCQSEDYTLCKYCEGSVCNVEAPPSAATINQALSLVTFLCSFILFKLMG